MVSLSHVFFFLFHQDFLDLHFLLSQKLYFQIINFKQSSLLPGFYSALFLFLATESSPIFLKMLIRLSKFPLPASEVSAPWAPFFQFLCASLCVLYRMAASTLSWSLAFRLYFKKAAKGWLESLFFHKAHQLLSPQKMSRQGAVLWLFSWMTKSYC